MDQREKDRTGQVFGFQQQTNPTDVNSDVAKNRQVIETPRLDAIPIPQDIPFSNSNPSSFAQLSSNIVQPITSATSLSANIYSHTLSQYGPAIIEQQQPDSPILRPQCITTPAIVNRPMGGIEINPEYNFVGLNDTRLVPLAASTTSVPNRLLFTRPATITSTSLVTPLTAGAAVLNNNRAKEPARNELVYSPPSLARDDTVVIYPNSGRPMGPDGRIPKKSNDKTALDSTDTLLDLQKLYRTYDDSLKNEKSARDRLDRDISSMMRGHRGQSIELDPIFCKMKDKKKNHESEMDRIEADLKKIENKMFTKFNYRMARHNDISDLISTHPGQSSKRQQARMSTGKTNNSQTKDTKSVDKKDIVLDLRDTNTWCNLCDLHFNNLRELAKHLHGHEHSGRIRKSTPWRSNNASNAKWDKNKTYQTMKSICSKLTNENDRNFTVNDIDRILNPSIDPKDPDMRARFISRERGRYDDDDPLFKVRGYDMIIPINGFYCQLCSRAMCDSLELEKHVMSYEHTFSHLKSMSLNSEHERKLRLAFTKSYQKEFPPFEAENDADKQRERSSKDDRRKDKPTSQHTQAAPRGYKKLTSSIVDDHESLKGLLPPAIIRPRSSLGTNETAKEVTTDKVTVVDISPSKKRRFNIAVPEIEPLSKNQATGALKRLKNNAPQTVSPDLTKEIRETIDIIATNNLESITSSSADEIEEQVITKVTKIKNKKTRKAKRVVDEAKIVDPDDPNNPHPGLRLSMYSNQHDDILTDNRLAQECVVKLVKLDLSDYKDLVIMDSSSKWTRIDALMAKRENVKEISGNAVTRTNTEPTFFSLDGQRIPVELDELASDDKKRDECDNVFMGTTTTDDNETFYNKAKKVDVEEFETGDNGDDTAGDITKKDTKSVREEVMYTEDENDEEKPVDVSSYMNALNDFFLEK